MKYRRKKITRRVGQNCGPKWSGKLLGNSFNTARNTKEKFAYHNL